MPSVSEMVTDNPVTKGAGEFLTRKYGPLPLWAWMLIVGGTAFGVRKLLDGMSKNASTDAATLTDQDTGAEPTLDTYTSGSGINRPNYGVGASAGSDGSATTTTSDASSVESWLSSATAVLTAQGFSGYDASVALRLYLANQTLNAQQKLLVNKAITAIGAPPVDLGAPPVDTTPTVPVQRSKKMTMSLTRLTQPAKVGGLVSFRVDAYDTGTNTRPTGTQLEVMVSSDAGKTYSSAGRVGLRNGTATYSRAIGSAKVYRFYVHVSPDDRVYSDTKSNVLEYDFRKLTR